MALFSPMLNVIFTCGGSFTFQFNVPGASDFISRGPVFDPHWWHHVVSLSKAFIPQATGLYPGSDGSVPA